LIAMSDIAKRKSDHLDLAARADIGFRQTTTLFECVKLVHDALPELDTAAIDLGTVVLGKRLAAPILIASMTGGTARAGEINRRLAAIVEERGYAIGLGSQRAMLRDPALGSTYSVRDVAPSALILANLGVVQAAERPTQAVFDLVGAVGADALCLHLNPAQELVQPEGDRDFRRGLETFERLSAELSVPVVAKETGCGLSARAGRKLASAGVRHVDVSGAGGTSWVAIETERAEGRGRKIGTAFREWGIPTAASIAAVTSIGFETVFATGGLATGLDLAKALALGATAGGFARPVLKALELGDAQARELLEQIEAELAVACALCGVPRPRDLGTVPRVVVGELKDWIEQASTA
jgi:isopentenyl-diphosphate delta-isomerase